MDEEKQIEELARSFCGFSKTLKCSECSYECHQKEYARKAFEAGYRLASDVAREIFAETHNMLLKMIRVVDDGLEKAIRNNDEGAKIVHEEAKETLRCVILCLAELKKKYMEGVNENTK